MKFYQSNEAVQKGKSTMLKNTVSFSFLLTYLKAMDKRVGLLINFNVERLKAGITRLMI